jgi:hypothetical protein
MEGIAMRRDLARAAKFAGVALLAIAFLFQPGVVHANAADRASVAKACKLIEEQKVVIARFMHPSSTLDKIVCARSMEVETGAFVLVYAFFFDGGRYNSSLLFTFFEDGSLNGIDVAGTTTWIKPFQAWDLLLSAVVQMVPQVGGSLKTWLKDGGAKLALEFWLRSHGNAERNEKESIPDSASYNSHGCLRPSPVWFFRRPVTILAIPSVRATPAPIAINKPTVILVPSTGD